MDTSWIMYHHGHFIRYLYGFYAARRPYVFLLIKCLHVAYTCLYVTWIICCTSSLRVYMNHMCCTSPLRASILYGFYVTRRPYVFIWIMCLHVIRIICGTSPYVFLWIMSLLVVPTCLLLCYTGLGCMSSLHASPSNSDQDYLHR